MKSKSYLFTYCYESDNHTLGFGSVTMTQERYAPINQEVIDDAIKWVRKEIGLPDGQKEVIDDAIKWVRKEIGLPDGQKIVPLAFIRFEEEEGET